jgi:hypothetical protein
MEVRKADAGIRDASVWAASRLRTAAYREPVLIDDGETVMPARAASTRTTSCGRARASYFAFDFGGAAMSAGS